MFEWLCAPRLCMLSMFVLVKGSSIWCFVTSICDAKLLIVKSASVVVSIPDVRSVLVDQYLLCSLILNVLLCYGSS